MCSCACARACVRGHSVYDVVLDAHRVAELLHHACRTELHRGACYSVFPST
jgi:hypothetical protein